MTRTSGFVLLPAIDLRAGRVVRLRQGDFDQETAYGDDPVAVARGFAAAGATWLHVVDLDGARSGTPAHTVVIKSMVVSVEGSAAVELAGGLRTMTSVSKALDAGAARVVLGTAALRQAGFAGQAVARFGAERIVVALDVRAGVALVDGWQADADGIPVERALEMLANRGVTTFEVTSVERDGTLAGPDLELLQRLVALDRGRIIASGGIAALGDLSAIREAGGAGAIVGRALYEGRFDIATALTVIGGSVD